jgi:hypothetical protein
MVGSTASTTAPAQRVAESSSVVSLLRWAQRMKLQPGELFVAGGQGADRDQHAAQVLDGLARCVDEECPGVEGSLYFNGPGRRKRTMKEVRMPRRSLIDAVADTVEERLRAEGLARQDRIFYLGNDLGDYALVELQGSSPLPGMERFLVNVAAAPAPIVDWVAALSGKRRAGRGVPVAADGLFIERVAAPGGGPHGMGWTVTDAASAVVTGGLLTDLLLAGPVKLLRGLVDRDRLRAELARRNRLAPDIEAALAAGDGPGERFEELLRRAVAWKDDSADFVAWARQYATRATANRRA